MSLKVSIPTLLFICGITSCSGQKPFGTEYLKLEKTIPLPNVSGRIDHMAMNLKEHLVYVAALGNNTVETVDLDKGAVIHSLKELDEPQGVCYIPESNELVVANGGTGDCVFYDAATYNTIATLHLAGDADNVRYDAAQRKIYVGYGNGGIAVIDAATHKQTGDVKLSAHPESFQLDQKNSRLFVNLPDANSVAVVDLNRLKIMNQWRTNGLKANFPMTLDTADNRVIIGYRHPALLVSYDGETGKEENRTQLVSDVDDVFFYETGQEVIASGGGGAINVFKKENGGILKIVANIPTRSGARTSLLIPALKTFLLAERATGGKAAALVVYKINK